MKLLATRARGISNCSGEVIARDGLVEPQEAGQTRPRGVLPGRTLDDRGDLAALPSRVRSVRLAAGSAICSLVVTPGGSRRPAAFRGPYPNG